MTKEESSASCLRCLETPSPQPSTSSMREPSCSSSLPKGCDTFVVFPPTSPPGIVLFGKNSDRPAGEGQSIQRYPAKTYDKNDGTLCQCTYISIPRAAHTYAVMVSQIDWMWGAEHGANEFGVVIGNEAVWTRVNDEDLATKRLLGMDLVRLGLERGRTAKEALQVITSLLEEHGQGGPCAQDDPSFTYHNSFMIVDGTEAWVLETAGRQWVAKRVVQGGCNISNTLTIRRDYDLHSKNLRVYAETHGLISPPRHVDTNDDSLLDWSACFGDGSVEECQSPYSRQFCGRSLLDKHRGLGTLTVSVLQEDILRNHSGGICMHGGGFETTASMVTEWRYETGELNNSTTTCCEDRKGQKKMQAVNDHEKTEKDGTQRTTQSTSKKHVISRHWTVEKPHPCQHEYLECPVL